MRLVFGKLRVFTKCALLADGTALSTPFVGTLLTRDKLFAAERRHHMGIGKRAFALLEPRMLGLWEWTPVSWVVRGFPESRPESCREHGPWSLWESSWSLWGGTAPCQGVVVPTALPGFLAGKSCWRRGGQSRALPSTKVLLVSWLLASRKGSRWGSSADTARTQGRTLQVDAFPSSRGMNSTSWGPAPSRLQGFLVFL